MAYREIEQIVIHCSDSDFGNADLIRKWHVDGNGWDDIGYHFVICNGRPVSAREYDAKWDGHLETGRRIETAGAHVKGHNAYSVGICMIGGKDGKFTMRQFETLRSLVKTLQIAHRVTDENVLGHRDLDAGKECPGFDVQDWLQHRIAA